jgi:2-methylfumaryl-CoA hydratase
VPGQVFVHPRGFTFLAAQMEAFARTYMQCNPLYLNEQYARASGFSGLLASPQMVFNVVLSLGVQNDSEKAMANLGYYDAQYLRPVHALDTIRSLTKVIDRKERGAGKPGIVTIRTLGINQNDEVVLQYERKIMVAGQGDRPPTTPLPPSAGDAGLPLGRGCRGPAAGLPGAAPFAASPAPIPGSRISPSARSSSMPTAGRSPTNICH